MLQSTQGTQSSVIGFANHDLKQLIFYLGELV
jgi:hypothetical protein